MTRLSDGFTIIELVVVVAILGIVAAIGFVRLPSDRLAVNQAADGLAADVKLARFQAISRNTYVEIRISPGTNSYAVLERDSGDQIKGVTLGSDGRSPSVRISSVDTPANNIVFDPRGIGIGAGPQNVEFSSQRSDFSRTVEISQQGRVAVK